MFKFVILGIKLITMNSINYEHSPDHIYPAIELDMTNFVEYLSDENIRGKVQVRNDDVATSSKVIDCKDADCTNLAEIFSVPEIKLEQEEKVSKFGKIFVFYRVKECLRWK